MATASLANQPVYTSGEPLTLSNAALKTYMTCPRQLYYSRLLHLPQLSGEAANLGKLVHRFMEWFNTSYDPAHPAYGHTPDRLLRLIDQIFDDLENLPDAQARQAHVEACGLTAEDWALMAPLGPLGRTAFAGQLRDSIADLSQKGYFQRYGRPRQILSEQTFGPMPVPAWSTVDHPVLLRGVIDALIQDETGGWHVVDYKRYGASVFATKPETCQTQFLTRLLSPLNEPSGFEERLNPQYPVDYQLPLYWLAFHESEDLAPCRKLGPLRSLSMQLVRPAFPAIVDQGAICLGVAEDQLTPAMPALLNEIAERVVTPLLSASRFETKPGPACKYCGYVAVCEGPSLRGLDGEGE